MARRRDSWPQGANSGASPALPTVRPDAYLIVAAGQRLYAPTLEELAEIAECAIAAGDEIERLRARRRQGWRPLSGQEVRRLVRVLAAALDVDDRAE